MSLVELERGVRTGSPVLPTVPYTVAARFYPPLPPPRLILRIPPSYTF